MTVPSSVEHAVSKRCYLVAVLVAAVLLVPAGFAAASGPNGTLQGFVTDVGTSAAIAGASVRIQADDLPWAFELTTDATGYYGVSLPNHLYTVYVSARAYFLNTTSAGVGSGVTTWFNVTLNPATARSARLQGYVTDRASSAPVTVGRIVAAPPWWSSGNAYRNTSAMNVSGYYQMDLVPGTYVASTDGIAGYATYSYSYLYLYAGPAEWFNISLDPSALVAWINGTVLDANNYTPIAGASVTASVDGQAVPPTVSNATGAYSLRVPTGTVEVAGDALGYAPTSGNVYVYSAGSYSFNIYLTWMSSGLRGYVRDGLTGGPIPRASVVASPFWSSGYYNRAVADATGAYAIDLPADDFDVSATAPGYTSWASYAFLNSGQVAWMNVTLWPIVAPVRGFVTDGLDGSPLAGRGVYAYDGRSGYSASAVSDATGRYSFSLPPSPAITIRIYGTAPCGGAIAYVTSRPYTTTWVNLTLARLDVSVVATVTDGQTGLPISAASVSLYWSLGSNWGSTDAGGHATIAAAGGLSITASVSAVGYFGWYGTLPALSGTYGLSVQLNPALAANVTVRGYVLDAATNASIVTAVVQAGGYDGSAPYDYTDGTGYYSLSVVTYPQTIQVTEYGYAYGVASINPAPGSTVWLNFSLVRDAVVPQVLSFTASPSTNLQPTNPAALTANVNEASLWRETLSILIQHSAAAGVGTFLNLGPLDASTVSVAPTTPGNVSVSAAWDTRSAVARLSDGAATEWWPTLNVYSPFEVAITGYWDNATLVSPTTGIAYFDTRDGRLLYVNTPYGLVGPQDDPTATFAPYASAPRIDLSTAAILGSVLVTGSTFQVGSLRMDYTNPVPGGPYAALLEVWDPAGNYARAATLLQVAADAIPPVARAGPDRTVGQGATVTFDGTASTDNVAVTSYTWTLIDDTLQTLYGASASYRFSRPGVYTVVLTVSDSNGNTATDTLIVTVQDTAPPTVALSTPTAGANISGSIVLTATASDNVGVVRVAFLVDGSPVGNATSAPFQLSLDTRTLANGNHTIEAVAYDAAGNWASTNRSVSVYNVPGAGGSPPGILGIDPLLFVILVVLLAAAGVGVAFLAARRRRPRAPTAFPPQGMTPQPPPPWPTGPDGTGPGNP